MSQRYRRIVFAYRNDLERLEGIYIGVGTGCDVISIYRELNRARLFIDSNNG